MILENLRTLAAELETTATDAVARIAPWAAPLPTAYLVGRATVLHLSWPVWVGVVAAVIIESLGLATTATALTLRDYNVGKRKSDPRAPFALAAILVGVYLATAVGLTVALDIAPLLAVYSPAIFPLLSLCGVTVLAMRGDHRRRLQAIATEKQDRKASRQAAARARQAEARAAQETASKMQDRRKAQATLGKAAETLALLAANPTLSQASIAQELSISRQAVGQHLGKLEQLGAIDRDNGAIKVLWQAQ